ncbi:MAG: hypothetical protein PGN34_00890 [Methylobacterium frigidaeris]
MDRVRDTVRERMPMPDPTNEENRMPHRIEQRRRVEARFQHHEQALAEIRSSAGRGANSRALQLQHPHRTRQPRRRAGPRLSAHPGLA